MKTPLLPALCATTLSACIPAPYGAYYRPAYPDPAATLRKAYCGGQAGPPSNLSFELPAGVRFSVGATRGYAERQHREWPLTIGIALPPGSEFQFLSDNLGISEEKEKPGRSLSPLLAVGATISLRGDAWVDIDALGPTPRAAAQGYLAANPGKTLAEVHFPGTALGTVASASLRLELPAIARGSGTPATPASIDLAADVYRPGSRIYRSAGAREALEVRYARCQRETPQAKCHYIREHDANSFQAVQGDFTYSGRVWVWDLAKPTPLEMKVSLESRSAEKWRLATPTIRLHDPATGETREQRIDTMNVAIRYAAPLSTRVFANPDTLQDKLSLRIESSLGDSEASHYFVTLPPFRYNGKEYRPAPIELELRRFDGGLEPFNC